MLSPSCECYATYRQTVIGSQGFPLSVSGTTSVPPWIRTNVLLMKELGAVIKELASRLRLSRSRQASTLQYAVHFFNFLIDPTQMLCK
jgi:hypothetical protein